MKAYIRFGLAAAAVLAAAPAGAATSLASDPFAVSERVATATDFAFGRVPEPASWALMIIGFGGAGAVLRRKRMPLG